MPCCRPVAASVLLSALIMLGCSSAKPGKRHVVMEAGVRNWIMQDLFPGKSVSHVGLMYDNDAMNLVIRALNDTP